MTQPSVTRLHGSAVLEAKIADLQAKPRPSDVDRNRLARLIEANNADRRWSAGLSRLPRIRTGPPSSTSNSPDKTHRNRKGTTA